MNNEERQRQMDFIVEQQAQFAVDILRLKETQEAEARLWREKYENLTDAMTTVVGIVGKLVEAQQRTDEQLSDLTTKQGETDDRLNIFINAVERYISEHRDGRARRAKTTRPSGRRKPAKDKRGKR